MYNISSLVTDVSFMLPGNLLQVMQKMYRRTNIHLYDFVGVNEEIILKAPGVGKKNYWNFQKFLESNGFHLIDHVWRWHE